MLNKISGASAQVNNNAQIAFKAAKAKPKMYILDSYPYDFIDITDEFARNFNRSIAEKEEEVIRKSTPKVTKFLKEFFKKK